MRSVRARLAIVVLVLGGALAAGGPAGAAAAPTRDVTRHACRPGVAAPFTDIAGSVHASAILCAADYGFVAGRTPTTFAPGDGVTRGQMASFLARALAFAGVQLDPTPSGFTDLRGSVHDPAIHALANLELLAGTSPTTFSPDRLVTRGQAATYLANALLLAQVRPEGPDAFTDDRGSVHEANINALAALGILSGVGGDRVAPDRVVTRAEAASLVVRTQDYAVEVGATAAIGQRETLLTALTGATEVPGPGDPAGRGTAAVSRTAIPGQLCVTIDIDVALASAITAAHVHRGAAGVAGPIVIPLPTPQADEEGRAFRDSCVGGLDPAVVAAVFADPAGHYVNVHTTTHPAGAVRGQLSPVVTTLSTALTGAEEAPGPGEAGASGDAAIDILADGTICGFVFYEGQGAPQATHIHRGAPGTAGPIEVPLMPFSPDGPVSDGCVAGTAPALVAEIVANPERFYINVHTTQLPAGAVRGQLNRLVTLSATLTGAAEVPGPGDPDGTGEATIDLVGDGLVCARLTVKGTDMPMAAHIHTGAAGVAGPIVVTLPTPMFGAASGCTTVSPAVADAVGASPAAHYVNVHTGAFPAGAVRGQLVRVGPGG